MPISKTPQQVPFPLRAIEELQPGVDRFEPIPTAQDVKDRYLFGIPLKSALTGETLSDSAIEFYTKAAISELEHTLDIYITPVRFTEKHDYRRHDFTWAYNFTKLDHSPILNVEKLELSFSNDANVEGFVQFPLEFVHVMSQEGTVQLVPAFGTTTSGFLLSAFSGTQYHALRATGILDFPGGVRITYAAGFDLDKVPAVISQLVGVMAAINILSLLGPILFPHTSISISIDSVSQGTGTFGPKHLNDRIAQLQAERDRQLEAVKGYYQKRFLVDYF
jgi:hypothetical protein